jgi:hypothetical protein
LSLSFGRTCAARSRTAALLLLFGLLLAVLPLQPRPAPAAFGASTASTASSSASLSLGFSASTLSPVSDGVPVYTVGDTIWAVSGYTYSITLSLKSPKAANAPIDIVAAKVLTPQVIAPLYTFTAKDTDGVWNVTLATQQGPVIIPVHFVNPAEHPVSLGPLAYSLDGGDLSISTQANLGDSYDQEVCATGSAPSAGISLNLPTDMGDAGTIRLTPGNPVGIATTGQVSESFSFWFELYYPYALDVTSATNLVADNLMAAESLPVAFVSSGTANTTLALNAPLREGRYEMRAYFQNSTSLDVVQSRVMILNDSSWVSLTNSCPPQTVQSQSISYLASLANGQASWPKTLYLMYQTFGVDAVASYPIAANVSSVNFDFSPWNESLSDVKVNVTPAAGVLQTSQEGSSLFVLSSKYPFQFNYTLDISGGHDLAQGSVTVEGSYAQTTEVLLAELTVHVLSDKTSPVTLNVTGPLGVNITRGPVGQTTSFLLPTGAYTVNGSQAGNSQSAQVVLTDGHAANTTLNFNALVGAPTQSSFSSVEVVLIVTAAVAAIANAVVWAFRSRSLRSRMASAPK